VKHCSINQSMVIWQYTVISRHKSIGVKQKHLIHWLAADWLVENML